MNKKKKNLDMTQGPMVKNLILFMIPLIGSGLFQQLYNTADFFFVGNYLGTVSATAVGASSTLINCTIGLFTGFSVGASVVISQMIGAHDLENAEKALHSSITFGLIIGSILALIAIAAAPFILNVMNTPEVAMSEAVLYMRIYFISMPMCVVYNMASGALRAYGDSNTPFTILAGCGILNVLMDACFVRIFPLGIAGVAIATVISQSVSMIWTLLALRKKEMPVQFSVKKMGIDMEIMKKIIYIGFPSGIQTVLVSFSNLAVQYYINGLGEMAVAAFATFYKTENLIYMPIIAFGQASTTFSGQNTGANQFKRIVKGTGLLCVMGSAVAVGLAAILLNFSHPIFSLFIEDKEVVELAIGIATIVFPFYWIYSIMESVAGALRGMGYSITSMAVTLSTMCILRIVLLIVVSKFTYNLTAISIIYPVTWAIAMIVFIGIFIPIMKKKV